MDDFIPHRIQHQLDGGMKPERDHHIAAMRFRRFQLQELNRAELH